MEEEEYQAYHDGDRVGARFSDAVAEGGSRNLSQGGDTARRGVDPTAEGHHGDQPADE